MDEAQGLGDHDPQLHAVRHAERAARQPGRRILAFEPVHRQPGIPARRRFVVHIPDDVRMTELREGPCLAHETVRVVALTTEQDLHGDTPAAREVASSVHLAHGASTRHRFQLEPPPQDLPGDHRRAVYVS